MLPQIRQARTLKVATCTKWVQIRTLLVQKPQGGERGDVGKETNQKFSSIFSQINSLVKQKYLIINNAGEEKSAMRVTAFNSTQLKKVKRHQTLSFARVF